MHPALVPQSSTPPGDTTQASEQLSESLGPTFQLPDESAMAPSSSPHVQDAPLSNGPQHSPTNADSNGDGDLPRGSTVFDPVSNSYKPKIIKPNKIYVGNLPGNTREEDLEGCFGELGRILSVELKYVPARADPNVPGSQSGPGRVGYGFVEFETREQAERAVQKYDGGLFLGNKIRCELSHGGGKTAKFAGDPGACFKCRQPGHWARECPNEAVDPSWRDYHRGEKPVRRRYDDSQNNRAHNTDDMGQYAVRSPVGYRDDYRGDVPARHPARDYRPDSSVPLGRDVRDYRTRDLRPPSPPPTRNYSRDYDEPRGPPRGPPPPPLSTGPYDRHSSDPRAYDVRSTYEARPPPGYGPDYDRPVPARDYGPPTGAPLPPGGYDRTSYATAYANGRSRSPVAYESRREYGPSSATSYDPYRGRGAAGAPPARYDTYSRRRSMSPPPRSAAKLLSDCTTIPNIPPPPEALPPPPMTSQTLFRNAHNVPLKCYIQLDAALEQAAEVKNLLERHGAHVSTYLTHALVILVDPPTPGGQLLIREFGSDTNRAILDFGWVKECVDKGRCIGPSENWGGHKLPVTNINAFFSYEPPPVPHPPYTAHPAAPALPSPAVSQSLPPSPVLTQRDRSESKPENFPATETDRKERIPFQKSRQSTPPPVSDEEPTPPDPSAMVLHHNGMGAKFTEIDTEYIRQYFRWSQKHHPHRTQRQVLEKIHEKMPYHTAVSITQYMRRHPDLFSEWKRQDIDPSLKDRNHLARSRDLHPDVPYDPGNTGNEDEPPKPPTNLIPFAKGYRFTTADDQFIISYFNWHAKKHPDSTKTEVLRDLAAWAPYRSLPSWTSYLHKNLSKWRDRIPSLRDDFTEEADEVSQGLLDDSTTDKDTKGDDIDGDLADSRRWNPPRRSAAQVKPISIPIPTDDDDASYDEHKPHSPRSPRSARMSGPESELQKRRRAEGQRRRSIAFSANERKIFIEFLADHPWVWTSITAPPEWLQGSTTASAVWQKFEKLYPHRSDASWREYHKRNAIEFDAEARRLRMARAAGIIPPAPPSVSASTDHDPVDDDDDYPEDEEPEDLQASSFSYHPLPPPEESEEEEDQLNTDDEDDLGMRGRTNGGADARPRSPSVAPSLSTQQRKGSRKGRPYLPFTQEQKERFMEFLIENPQVWTGAEPEPGWVSWEQSHQGKDTTWRKLSAIPGMENHSYKSWREYHRARAGQVDKQAKEMRLSREAAQRHRQELAQPLPPLPPPPQLPHLPPMPQQPHPSIPLQLMPIMTVVHPLPSAGYDPIRKRSREPEEMELSTPITKRSKVDSDETMQST
ncbi:hypothetical protein FRB99_005753 [Tulasnella sp. 403]|nr:hypothetical protein FRB99_005753 [Tulasnella sp. 403]